MHILVTSAACMYTECMQMSVCTSERVSNECEEEFRRRINDIGLAIYPPSLIW